MNKRAFPEYFSKVSGSVVDLTLPILENMEELEGTN